MIFRETQLPGVYTIDLDLKCDERGGFARTWCCREAEDRGLTSKVVQCNISVNKRRGTLRGMHFQAAPHEEAKLVRCTKGSIYDVVLDLRPHSPTFKQWTAAVLTAAERNMMYVPEGCAHGFLTLEDDSEVFYQMSEFYNPEAASGFRWDDPAFGIAWPEQVTVISERDRTYPDFERPA
jgi:dTDP-4-dehydrorhamnose 3,5-epimerase